MGMSVESWEHRCNPGKWAQLGAMGNFPDWLEKILAASTAFHVPTEGFLQEKDIFPGKKAPIIEANTALLDLPFHNSTNKLPGSIPPDCCSCHSNCDRISPQKLVASPAKSDRITRDRTPGKDALTHSHENRPMQINSFRSHP